MAQKASLHMSEAKRVCPGTHGELRWWQDPAAGLDPATGPRLADMQGRLHGEVPAQAGGSGSTAPSDFMAGKGGGRGSGQDRGRSVGWKGRGAGPSPAVRQAAMEVGRGRQPLRAKEPEVVWQLLQQLREDISRVYTLDRDVLDDGLGCCAKVKKDVAFWAKNEPKTYDCPGRIDNWEDYLRGCSTLNVVKLGRLADSHRPLYDLFSHMAVEMESHSSVNVMVGQSCETLQKWWDDGHLCMEEVTRLLKVQLRKQQDEEGLRMRKCHYFQGGDCMAGAECRYFHV